MKNLIISLLFLTSCRATVLVKGTNQDGDAVYFEALDAKERPEILYFKPHWLFKQDTVQVNYITDFYIKIDTVINLN